MNIITLIINFHFALGVDQREFSRNDLLRQFKCDGRDNSAFTGRFLTKFDLIMNLQDLKAKRRNINKTKKKFNLNG